MTLSETISQFVVNGRYEDLDDSNITSAKSAISDCIGCAIAGSAEELGKIIQKVALASSSVGQSTLLGSIGLVSPQAAALANGTSAHALDFDDILWSLYGHPSTVVCPAAWAIAESTQASGKDLILAFAMGVEVIGKLGRFANPMHYEHGWHATGTIGVIGATVACSKLMGLNALQTAHAIGIAASQACGVRRNFGTMTKPFHAGNAARGGVMACELALQGFTSDLTALEGTFGWFYNMQATSIPTSNELKNELGSHWELSSPGIVLKRYPACGGTHCALDAMIYLKKKYNFSFDQIQSIHCNAHPLAKKVLLYPRPKTALEGKFSMEFSLAVAAIEGQASKKQYDQSWIEDSRVITLLEKINFHEDAQLFPNASADAVPAEVTVVVGSQSFTKKVVIPSGDPRNPMQDSDRLDKFLSCTDLILEGTTANKLWQQLENLDEATSVSGLLQAVQ